MQISFNLLKSAISNFDHNFIVVGDLMLDKYLYGKTNRISQEAPVPVVSVNGQTNSLGGCGNVFNNLLTLGSASTLIGRTSNDNNSEIISEKIDKLKQQFTEEYVDYLLLKDNNIPTTTKTRIMSMNQQVLRYDQEIIKKISNENMENLKSKIDYIEKNCDIDGIIVSDYGKGMITQEVLDFLHEYTNENKLLYIDPNPRTKYSKYLKNTVVLPNEFESKDINLKYFNIKVITRGDKGIDLITENEKINIPPAYIENVFDTIGAGDTVTSTFANSIASGLTLQESCFLSNVSASIAIRNPGTYSVSNTELYDEIQYLETIPINKAFEIL